MKVKRRTQYYILGMLPILVVWYFFYFTYLKFELPLVDKCFFFLAYWWNFTLFAPGMLRKIAKRRYRFSFVRFAYLIQRYLGSFILAQKIKFARIIARMAVPVVFISGLSWLFDQGDLLISIAGVVFFELIFFLGMLFQKILSRRSLKASRV